MAKYMHSFFVILITTLLFVECKSQRKDMPETVLQENKLNAEFTKSNFRKRFEISDQSDEPSALYFVSDGASDDELRELANSEFNSSKFSLTAPKTVFRYQSLNTKIRKIKHTYPKKKVAARQLIRSGRLDKENTNFEPIGLINVLSGIGKQIPVGSVKTFDDIPVGSGEFVYVFLTKKQYSKLNSQSRLNPSNKTINTYLRDTPDGSGVIIMVKDNSLKVAERDLDTGKPLMFDLDNPSLSRHWDTVQKDFARNIEDIETELSNSPVLGKGNFGSAYLVQKPDGLRYVIKKMPISKEENLREISVLTGGSCLDCLQYLGAVKKGDHYYLASEYAGGGELAKRVKIIPIKRNEIISLLKQGKQLADNGLINKDIKLENVLITDDGNIKIMDFGIAQKHPTRFKMGGTPHTVAPEVAQQLRIPYGFADRVHTYSLGMSIFDGKMSSWLDYNYEAITVNNTKGTRSNIEFVQTPPFTHAEKEILVDMLEPDFMKRISISEALARWEALP